jgi:hypothetical protein
MTSARGIATEAHAWSSVTYRPFVGDRRGRRCHEINSGSHRGQHDYLNVLRVDSGPSLLRSDEGASALCWDPDCHDMRGIDLSVG